MESEIFNEIALEESNRRLQEADIVEQEEDKQEKED